ncbi:MAG: cold-shock protein [Promethearchaeota archaeon]
MRKGIVKWFNPRKGYGFINLIGDENNQEKNIFVHYSNILSNGFRILHENDDVEFEIKQGDKGLEAINVVVVKKGEDANRDNHSSSAG